jgi:ElaB/YqjD/DUF883 family membrane-anchored ribosome-binding protein
MKNNPPAGTQNRSAEAAADKVAAQVESTVSDLAQRGREASRSVREVTDNFSTALDRSLDRQPMTTVALAVAVGFVLGALWKT